MLALACLTMRMICAARNAFFANIVHDRPLGTVTKIIDLGTFERTVTFALRKKGLKVRRQHLDHLVGQFFARFDVLVTIGLMVCHVIPLDTS